MKKLFALIFFLFSPFAFSAVESVQPIRAYYINDITKTSSTPQIACQAHLFGVSGTAVASSSFPSICNISYTSGGGGSVPISLINLCPSPPQLPYFVYNNATLMCERNNPCPPTTTAGLPFVTTVGWSLGTHSVGSSGTTCGLNSCLELRTVTSSILGINTWSIDYLPQSCQPEGTPLPAKPMIVTFTPPSQPIPTQTPADKAAFDQLVADKVLADAKSAAAAAASANATTATAAQAAADQAAADAYIASVIARANAIKAGLPSLTQPTSTISVPPVGNTTGGNTTTAGGTTGGVVGGSTGGTTSSTGGTATCATFSICNVEQYLNDIKNALGFGQSFDSAAAAADAKVATMEIDGQTAQKKVGVDAAAQEVADESLIKSAFQIPALRTTCTPITKVVMGRPLSMDFCFYTEILRQIIAFLFGLFGAFSVYQIAFRKK